MTTELTTSQADLIALLDPTRNYGERTFEQVLAGIHDGSILIEPGQRLPMLFTAENHRSIKGTGQAPQDGVSNTQRALQRFRSLGLDDVDDAYAELRAGMKAGDPRFHKIYWENLLGKMGETKGGEAMAEAFKALITALEKPDVRTVTFDQ